MIAGKCGYGGHGAGEAQLPKYRICSVHLCPLSCVWICGFELRKSAFFFLGSLELKVLKDLALSISIFGLGCSTPFPEGGKWM